MSMTDEKRTTFGFEEVSEAEKVSRVDGVFRSVASKYDVMNDVMSMGIHRLWKHDVMNKVNPQPGEVHVDVAGGTGELARAFIELADKAGKRRGDTRKARAIVCDINDAMLAAGEKRKDSQALEDRLTWVCGDGQNLPLPDNSADVISVSLGIRNFGDRVAGLRDFKRVLKPGGRLAILEFSHMTAPALQKAYDTYSFSFIPAAGKLITGDRASYQYLVESIRQFPKADEFKAEFEMVGFKNVSVTKYNGGIVAMHFGWNV